MPGVKLTLTFNSLEEACAYLRKLHDPSTPISGVQIPVTAVNAPQPVQQPATAVVQAQQPAAATIDDAKAAMLAYIQKQGGRTAATAKALMAELGLNSIKDAEGDSAKLASLVTAFQTR